MRPIQIRSVSATAQSDQNQFMATVIYNTVIYNLRTARIIEKTVKTTSASSILIRQTIIAFIDNILKIVFVFRIFLFKDNFLVQISPTLLTLPRPFFRIERMPRLICVFAGHSHFVNYAVLRLKCDRRVKCKC